MNYVRKTCLEKHVVKKTKILCGQLSDRYTTCRRSHPQGKGEVRCQNPEAL